MISYIYGSKTRKSNPEDRDIRALCGPSSADASSASEIEALTFSSRERDLTTWPQMHTHVAW